jgi:hypothetical protein
LAILNVVDTVRVLDLYLTGKASSQRDPAMMTLHAETLVRHHETWRHPLSDDEGTILVIEWPRAVRNFVYLDPNASRGERALEGWRLIDNADTRPDPDLNMEGQEIERLARRDKVIRMEDDQERADELNRLHQKAMEENDGAE